MLAWQEHITARHAVWGVRLLRALLSAQGVAVPLWVSVARVILLHISPQAHPALTFLAAGQETLPWGPLRRCATALACLGPTHYPVVPAAPGDWCARLPLWRCPLLRLELPFVARPAAYRGLVSHPMATSEDAIARMQPLALLPRLRTVGDVVVLVRQLNAVARQRPWTNSHAHLTELLCVLDPTRPARIGAFPDGLQPDLYNVPRLVESVCDVLWAALPACWRAAAVSALRTASCLSSGLPADAEADRGAVLAVLEGAGWVVPTPAPFLTVATAALGGPAAAPHDVADVVAAPAATHAVLLMVPPAMPVVPGSPQPLRADSVRLITSVLSAPRVADLHSAWAVAVREALRVGALARPLRAAVHADAAGNVQVLLHPSAPSPGSVALELHALSRRVSHVWRLPWDNAYKEVWWRLLLHGVPGAGGHGVCLPYACGCSWTPGAAASPADRALAWQAHVFWSCPVAVGVRDLLQTHLPVGTLLMPRHLWLCVAPAPTVHPGVWSVVALAALSGILAGRRLLAALSAEAARARAQQGGGRQLTIYEAFQVPDPHAPQPPPQRAAREAVVRTLAAVTNFAAVGCVPEAWQQSDLLTPDHAFLGMMRGTAGCRLVLNFDIPADA